MRYAKKKQDKEAVYNPATKNWKGLNYFQYKHCKNPRHFKTNQSFLCIRPAPNKKLLEIADGSKKRPTV